MNLFRSLAFKGVAIMLAAYPWQWASANASVPRVEVSEALATGDEVLDADFASFFARKKAVTVPRQNAAIGLAGIDAPLGSDFWAFGSKVTEHHRALEAGASQGVLVLDVPGRLKFVGTEEQLACWDGTQTPCAAGAELATLLRNNKELIRRYRTLLSLKTFQDDSANGQVLILLNRLIAAEIYARLRHGEYDMAYRQWHDNFVFLRRALADENGWVAKAILVVALGHGVRTAEQILYAYPEVAAKHGDEFLQALKPSGLKDWNVAAAIRAEYFLFEPALLNSKSEALIRQNYIRNRVLRHSKQVLAAASSHPKAVRNKLDALAKVSGKYCPGVGPESNAASLGKKVADANNAVLCSVLNTQHLGPLVLALHRQDGYMRALSLAVWAKQRGMADAQVRAFIANSRPEFFNPFSDAPMIWDEKLRVIRFTEPVSPSVFDVRLPR